MICLSFDQDWAPEWATRELLDLLGSAGVPGTLFLTNQCPAIGSAPDNVELGVHPNFHPGSSHGESQSEVLDTVAKLVPGCSGVRAHGLVSSTALWGEYVERGYVYESADLMDGLESLRPLIAWHGLVRLPIYWEDDVALLHDAMPESIDELVTGPGMRVFNMHPILIALDASSLDGYQALKIALTAEGRALHTASRDEVLKFRTGRPGVGALLEKLVDWLAKNPQRCGGTLNDVAVNALANR